jgi:DNA-binding NarL/FixJ family response regulator
MDIKMEPMDGLTATRAIIASHPFAKIIILTSYDDARYRKAAREAGTIAFVSKEHLQDIPTILSTHCH